MHLCWVLIERTIQRRKNQSYLCWFYLKSNRVRPATVGWTLLTEVEQVSISRGRDFSAQRDAERSSLKTCWIVSSHTSNLYATNNCDLASMLSNDTSTIIQMSMCFYRSHQLHFRNSPITDLLLWLLGLWRIWERKRNRLWFRSGLYFSPNCI